MEAAAAALAAAGERQAKLDALETEAKPKLDEFLLKNRKQGRPTTAVAICKRLMIAALNRLERGKLPGEVEELTYTSKERLAADAKKNAQHHRAPSHLPSPGRPHSARTHASGMDADDADDADQDDDAGEDDPSFGQYYAVAPHQRAFNERVTKSYLLLPGCTLA